MGSNSNIRGLQITPHDSSTDPRTRLQRSQSVPDLGLLAQTDKTWLSPARIKSRPKIAQTDPFNAQDCAIDKFYATKATLTCMRKPEVPPLKIAREAVAIFRAAPADCPVCGVLHLAERTIYLCPLKPAKGGTPFAEKRLKDYPVKGDTPSKLIVHTDISQRANGGRASHDQLGEMVDPSGDFVGFTVWKGRYGEAIVRSFTSRSQNTSKFGEVVTIEEVEAESERNEELRREIKQNNEILKKLRADPAYARQKKEAETAWKIAAAQWEKNPIGPPPAPPPPETDLGGTSSPLAAQRTIGLLSGSGINPGGVVSMEYVQAILKTFAVYFPKGEPDAREV